MSHFDIIREQRPAKTFRVASVMGTYDLQTENVTEHFEGDIDLPAEWNIGLIVGHSGTGKTTIARELFADSIVDQMQYTHESILDDMPRECTTEQICKALNSVGFSAPPQLAEILLRTFERREDALRHSTRNARTARNVRVRRIHFRRRSRRSADRIVRTTESDQTRRKEVRRCDVSLRRRTVAHARLDLQHGHNAVSDHGSRSSKKNRPEIKIDIFETRQKQHYWRIFRKYHYLNHSFNEAAHVYIATVNGSLAAMVAVLAFPHPKTKNIWREHRIVVLPDYQGIGISRHLTDFIAQRYKDAGNRYICATSHTVLIMSRKSNPNWITTRIGRAAGVSKSKKRQVNVTSHARITASFEYIGSSAE